MPNYMPFGIEFNSNVVNDINDINKKIDEETKKDTVDNEKIMKLRMERLYKGMKLNTGCYGNNYRAMFPY